MAKTWLKQEPRTWDRLVCPQTSASLFTKPPTSHLRVAAGLTAPALSPETPPCAREVSASAFLQDAPRGERRHPQPRAPAALRGAGPNAGRLGEAPGAGSPVRVATETQRLLPGKARRQGTSVHQTLSKGFFSHAHVSRFMCAHYFIFRTSFLNQPRKAQAYNHGAAFPNWGAQFSC